MTTSRGQDWGGPVFDSPMLKLALSTCTGRGMKVGENACVSRSKYFGYVLTSPQSERVLRWGVILEMPRIGFTRVQEAWCRVPKSPRESREVTGVMFRKPVGKKKSLMLLWRVSPRLGRDCREVASQSALSWELWLCGEAVHA
ncbi:hypothetical protein ACLB2K_071028 [Fragaria x ananassa]